MSELIKRVRASEVFQSVMAGDDWKQWEKTDAIKELNKSRKLIEFLLRMDIWEASDKLLGGGAAVATYPTSVGEDPDFAFFIRPSESSQWLADRIRTAPLIRVGVKRVGRNDFGESVAAYRTRGFRDGATYFALHSRWVVVSSSEEILKKTVALQEPGGLTFKKGAPLAWETPYQSMTKRMGVKHSARAFLNTQKIAEQSGENLGLPKTVDDPVLALFLGGIVELVDSSRFAGFTLDYDEKQIAFKAGIDAKIKDIKPEHRLFFAGSPEGGLTGMPKVPGYIGGFTLYRPFGDWYRGREDAVQTALIPGMEGFEGSIGDLLLGKSGAAGSSIVGDRIAFVSAQATDGGVDFADINLPGFGFIIDLADEKGADPAIRALFESALKEIDANDDRAGSPWAISENDYKGVKLIHAKRAKAIGTQPLVPAIARVGDRCVLTSSRQLAERLIDALGAKQVKPVLGKDMAFDLQFTELSKFFAANRAQYEAEFIRRGRSPIQAKADYENLSKLMAGLKSFSGSSGAIGGTFEFTARGELR